MLFIARWGNVFCKEELSLIVRKRDNTLQEFSIDKIKIAIEKAMKAGGSYSEKIRDKIAEDVFERFKAKEIIPICDIEIAVFDQLVRHGKKHIARLYEGYRAIREFQRNSNTDLEKQLLELLDGTSDYWNSENSNKNEKLVTTQRDYMAGIVSKHIAQKYIFSPELIQAHNSGILHIHDLDYIGERTRTNCCLINLEDVLQNGTVLNGVAIDKPHRLLTAVTIATQIILGVSSSQFGGATITLTHLAPFVRDSYNLYLKKYADYGLNDSDVRRLADIDLHKEITDAVQTFNYQVNSMSSSNGQAPFISVFMYISEDPEYRHETALLIKEFLNQRIQGMKNRTGVYVTQAFPKLIYTLDEDNIHEDSEYYWLTKLAIKSTAKRMNPDYVSAKVMKEYKGSVFPSMGCRSWLTVDTCDENFANANNWKKHKKYYGRFNQCVVTINLPDVALSSGGDVNLFWKLLDERAELCHKALRTRHERLKSTLSDVAPILWQDGALARLKVHEPIDKLLYNNYSTISLGYAGLYECVKYMTGHSHTENTDSAKFGLAVMQVLNDKCNKWKEDENIGYSVYGSPKISLRFYGTFTSDGKIKVA